MPATVESLEDRLLLSASVKPTVDAPDASIITEFNVPTEGSEPSGITTGPDAFHWAGLAAAVEVLNGEPCLNNSAARDLNPRQLPRFNEEWQPRSESITMPRSRPS